VTARPALRLAALLVAALAPLAYVLWLTPVAADGWDLVLRARELGRGPGGILAYARWAHFHHNPRLGEVFDYLVHAEGALHVVLTPLVLLGTLAALHVLAFGAWPRARAPRDLGRVLLLFGGFALGIPAVGQMLAYRPFTTNYVYGFAFVLALAVPYRLEWKARGAAAAAGVFLLGVCAGLANEHTGPATGVALAALTAWRARREQRVPAWAVAGIVGLAAGLVLLLTAPGQAERYHGLATEGRLWSPFVARGLGGNAGRVGLFLLCTCVPLAIIGGTALATRRRPRPVVLALLAVALAMVLTVLLSPKQGLRLYYAPAALLVAAAAATLDGARRVVTFVAAAAWLVCMGKLIAVYRGAAEEASARRALLAEAAPGSTPSVPPYAHFGPTWFVIGDDFRAAHVRQKVARRLYGLEDAWLDVHGAARLAATGPVLTLTPRLPPAAEGLSGQVYEPADLEVTLARFRDAVASLGAPATLRVDAPVLPALGGRPLELASWRDGTWRLPTSVAPGAALPAGAWTILVGGEARRSETTFQPWQDGAYVIATCDASACRVIATAAVHSGHGPLVGW
jgi:hypothetical protein